MLGNVTYNSIASDEDIMGGEPRVEGTRIAVRQIAEMLEKSESGIAVVANRLNITMVEAHESMAYYHSNPDEFRKIRAQRKREENGAEEHMITSPRDLATLTEQ